MKVFLTSFGLYNPCIGPRLQAHSVMPIAIDTRNGFDLDYSALLTAESFIIDKGGFEFIKEYRNRFLGPMYHSLEVLKREGLLEVRDYAEPCRRFQKDIEKKSSELLEDVQLWLSIARKQWTLVRSEFEEFSLNYSDPYDREFNAAHYGVVAYLERRDGKIDPVELVRLHALMESKRRKLKASEEMEVREILKPLIAQVLINDLLRRWLKAPFIDWDDAQGFHDRLYYSQWVELDESYVPAGKIAKQAQQLFQVVVPELLPERIEAVVKFLHNRKAVASLRQELWHLMNEGQTVSKDWMLSLQSEATKAQIRAASRNRVIKWAGRIAGFVIPGADIVGDILQAAQLGTESIINSTARTHFEWYYALQQLKLD